jgi:hypothetical protein
MPISLTDWITFGLSIALEVFKSLNKPLEEITYEDLRNFRSFDEIYPPTTEGKNP